MNILVVTNRVDDVNAKLSRLTWRHPSGQRFACIGITSTNMLDQTALTPAFDFDTHYDPNNHLLIVSNDIYNLHHSAREMLDIVIEIGNEDIDEAINELLEAILSEKLASGHSGQIRFSIQDLKRFREAG